MTDSTQIQGAVVSQYGTPRPILSYDRWSMFPQKADAGARIPGGIKLFLTKANQAPVSNSPAELFLATAEEVAEWFAEHGADKHVFQFTTHSVSDQRNVQLGQAVQRTGIANPFVRYIMNANGTFSADAFKVEDILRIVNLETGATITANMRAVAGLLKGLAGGEPYAEFYNLAAEVAATRAQANAVAATPMVGVATS